ncbi:MAG: DHH family phosphoesterase, partial [Xanthomonadales bacterium]|nr:DHH family phosphoesterase [Xanthomonadales bacterium]
MRIERRPCPATQGDWPTHIHPVLRRIYAARGIQTYTDVEHRLARLLSPQSLSGLDAAVVLLAQAIDKQQRVLIVGDYDCDGATGCAVAVRGLRLLGMQHVGYQVPNRMRHGYGLSVALVEQIESLPDLLITVDNGINSHAGVAAAKARGIQVI